MSMLLGTVLSLLPANRAAAVVQYVVIAVNLDPMGCIACLHDTERERIVTEGRPLMGWDPCQHYMLGILYEPVMANC
jgi:hypothetical protein